MISALAIIEEKKSQIEESNNRVYFRGGKPYRVLWDEFVGLSRSSCYNLVSVILGAAQAWVTYCSSGVCGGSAQGKEFPHGWRTWEMIRKLDFCLLFYKITNQADLCLAWSSAIYCLCLFNGKFSLNMWNSIRI